jgi:hypothetical protein
MILWDTSRPRHEERGDHASNPRGTPQNWLMFWTALSAVATSLAAGFSGWAAYEAARSVSETARATRTTTILQMVTEYASPETFNAMTALRTWKAQHQDHAIDDFVVILTKQDLSVEDRKLRDQLDGDRRRLVHFFGKLMILQEIGAIDPTTIHSWWSEDTLDYITSILIPIDLAKGRAEYINREITKEEEQIGDKEDDKLLAFCVATMTENPAGLSARKNN